MPREQEGQVKLPPGVKRCLPNPEGTGMIARSWGDWISVSDLPKIEAAVEERVREGLLSAASEAVRGGPIVEAHEWRDSVLRSLDSYTEQGGGEGKAALDAEFDTAIEQSEGTEGHRLKLNFDDGVRVELIHPESGCKPPGQCIFCAADLTDPESKRCYDCKGIDPNKEACWLTSWVDEQGDELIRGSATLPVAVTWETDYPLFHLPVVRETEETHP